VAEWRGLLGGEFEAASRLLSPDSSRASAHPCSAPKPCGCYHDVIEHGPEDIVAVCSCRPRRCETLTLTQADIVVYELDRRALGDGIAAALGAVAQHAPVTGLQRTWSIGTYVSRPGHPLPVHLTVQTEPADFARVAEALVARAAGPFILAAPTRDLLTPQADDVLRRARAQFIPLAEEFELDPSGSIRPRRSPEEMLAPLLGAAPPTPTGIAVAVTGSSEKDAQVFRRQGRSWLVVYERESRTIEHTKGMAYLSHLIQSPDRVIPSATLRDVVTGAVTASVLGSAGEDPEARSAYRELREIDADLAEVRANHDEANIERLERSREKVVARLKKIAGLDGEPARESVDEKRVRQSVSKAIKIAIDAIHEEHPSLGRHLRRSVDTGTACVYRPASPVPWTP